MSNGLSEPKTPLERIYAMAYEHGQATGEDHECGDLMFALSLAFDHLTPEQQASIEADVRRIAADSTDYCNNCGLPLDEFGQCSSILAGAPCTAIVGPLD